jgi:arabinofuranosyltransferase
VLSAYLALLRSRRLWLVVLVGLALLARLLPGPRTIDDAFITFRYARNLLEGYGLVYNPGEQVLGTTTPLYAGLMAGLGALSGGTRSPFPALALGVNALADALTCLVLVRMGAFRPQGKAPLARWAGWAAGFAWAVAPFSVTFAIGGLETSVYVLLLCGMALAALERRRVLAALLAALALLTRPDALILIGLLGIERLLALRQPGRGGPWRRELLVFGLPVLGWGLFATLTYGSPLPNSIAAKAAAYLLQPGDALVRLLQHFATPFLEHNWLGAPLAVGIGLLLYPALAVLGARQAGRASTRWLPFALYPWLYLLTFALPNPLIFRWYLTPPLPAYFLMIFLGMEGVANLFNHRPEGRRAPSKDPQAAQPGGASVLFLGGLAVSILSFILGLSPLVSEWRIHPDHGPDRPAPEMAFIKLELLYRQAAEQLAPQLSAGSLLAAGDVGVLGFYTPARILDTVGLNSPVSSRYYPLPPADYVINYAIPAALVLDQRPDWVVILEVYGRRTLLQDPAFLNRYSLFQKIETDMYGSNGMLIFKSSQQP